MFTGIVEEVGRVRSIERGPGGADARLVVAGPGVVPGVRFGESIAVEGVCLTVAWLEEGVAFGVDVMPETLRRTSLGGLVVGSPVNLERAVRVDGRLDGHIVQGHVDGVATVVSRAPGPRWDEVVFSLDRSLARYVALKGSVAVSGVSLTVSGVGEDWFAVSLIPTTLAGTTLGAAAVGSRVNVEVDVVAKYVERLGVRA